MTDNEKFIKRAIEISKQNIENGGGPFGAVIVKNGKIIAESGNSVTKTNDPTAHAEVNAIRLAAKELGDFDLSGCEIYSSCEPCPMCLGAIYWARIDKLYFAAGKEDAEYGGFSDKFIYDELELDYSKRSLKTTQLMRDEAKKVFDFWLKYDEKTPY
jgi:tRNA(Arg) A34 adenosine deaminase TadA